MAVFQLIIKAAGSPVVQAGLGVAMWLQMTLNFYPMCWDYRQGPRHFWHGVEDGSWTWCVLSEHPVSWATFGNMEVWGNVLCPLYSLLWVHLLSVVLLVDSRASPRQALRSLSYSTVGLPFLWFIFSTSLSIFFLKIPYKQKPICLPHLFH